MPPPNSTQTTDDFDLQAWLADISADASLPQEEVQRLSTILGNDKIKSKLRDQFLMRRDYSRKTQEVADQRRQLDQDVENVLAERADLAKWKAGVDGQLKKAYADLDSERMTTSQFRARIATIAEQNGLDPAELMQGIKDATNATGVAARDAATNNGGRNGGSNGADAASNLDPTKFVSTDDFYKFARQSPMLYAEVEDIFSEHQELTGKPLKMEYTDSAGKKWTGRRALLVKTSEHNNRAGAKPMSVRDTWEADFNISAVRQQQLESSIEAKLRDKLETEFKTKTSELMLQGGTPGRTTSLADRPKSVLFDDKRDQRTPAERDAAASPNGDKGTSPLPVDSGAHREERWQRAASGFMDRRSKGVPMGQEAPPAGGSGL